MLGDFAIVLGCVVTLLWVAAVAWLVTEVFRQTRHAGNYHTKSGAPNRSAFDPITASESPPTGPKQNDSDWSALDDMQLARFIRQTSRDA